MSRVPPSSKGFYHMVHTWTDGRYHYFEVPGFCPDKCGAINVAESLGLLQIMELNYIADDTIGDIGTLHIWTYLDVKWDSKTIGNFTEKELKYINEVPFDY